MVEKRNEKYSTIVYALVYFTITYLIVYKQSLMPSSDYAHHMEWAKEFWTMSYPLWHFLVWVSYKVLSVSFGASIEYACAITTAIVNMIIYLLVCWGVKKEQINKYPLIAFVMCFATAVYCPWYSEKILIGQGCATTWHNPTNMMAKPFMLILFYLVVKLLSKIQMDEVIAAKEYILVGLVLLVSTLAKPSLFQGFIPALGLFMLISLVVNKGKGFIKYLITCVACVPAFLVIVGQFLFNFYGSDDTAAGIGIGWAIGSASKNVWFSLLITILFPLVYCVCNYKEIKSSLPIQLAWLFFLVAWAENMLLYEKGERMSHGNFSWAYQLSCTALWIVTSVSFFKEDSQEYRENKLVKNGIIFVIWCMHIISGFIYAYRLINIENMWY